MLLLEKHQKIAILLYGLMVYLAYIKHGMENLKLNALVLFGALLLVLFYRVFGSLMGMGFMASLAKDHRTGANKVGVAFLMWLFFLIIGAAVIFGKGVQ